MRRWLVTLIAVLASVVALVAWLAPADVHGATGMRPSVVRYAALGMLGAALLACWAYVRLAARWGAARSLVLTAGLAAVPIVAAVGVENTIRHARVYAGLRCPPGVVMVSENEHAMIRAVRDRTPADARIAVVSDENSWFLNYYLHPRRLFQHSDEALTAADLPPDWLANRGIGWVLEHHKGQPFRLRPLSDTPP